MLEFQTLLAPGAPWPWREPAACVSPRHRRMLEYIRQRKRVTALEIAKFEGITRNAARERMARLMKGGVVTVREPRRRLMSTPVYYELL